MNKHSPHILVFDSGVGGLTIVEAIQAQFPSVSISYASDNKAFPYGTKPEEVLIERVSQLLNQLHKHIQPDLIVIACNTASTVVLPHIREAFQEPIIGVVPAIKPAAEISKTHVIGLLATPGTVKRAYTKQLIADYASHCDVISVGSAELVSLAESKLKGEAINIASVREAVSPFAMSKQLDTLILGCTHFPLLKQELKSALPNIEFWIDSGEAIARRVEYFINKFELGSQAEEKVLQAYFTDINKEVELLGKELERRGFDPLLKQY